MLENHIWFIFAALLVSVGVTALTVNTKRWHGRLSMDFDLAGVQKLHERPVPRVGGLALAAGLFFASGLMYFFGAGEEHHLMLLLLVCGIPTFVAGLLEDITKKVSVVFRLLASVGSAGLAVWLVGAQLSTADTYGLDVLLSFAPLAVLFTCFAVSGVTNAVNIIDGLNGLASGSVVIMLLGLAGLAYMANDHLVVTLSLSGAGALLGFMFYNFPFGRIFLGDGGAYLAGFWLAECAILLLVRNPSVSTWAVMLVCIYPVWETVFSIWRRRIYRGVSMSQPDRVHFHTLVYRRIVSQRVKEGSPYWVKHAFSSAYVWVMVLACQLLALTLYGFRLGEPFFIFGVLLFTVVYAHIYRRMVQGVWP